MANAIEFENVSKQYRLGLVGTGTLAHDIRRFWITNVLRQEDPYLKIGETNDRTSKGNSDYVWALRDITFNVEQGDVVGIIGKNGAGKSTLLKLLSRVTGPTTGTIRAHGRIGSLLEVGTGFHPEMTGRENIFMNGAILGMTKREIQAKLDEIIDFSGCERYIDTPVKRYSSGMMVRLGFAVAAHLDPEILVVDEVLAVGDAEFQKKAIGKMQDVSKGEGRTVLFVSHNMASVKQLCKSGIVLKNGMVDLVGSVDECVAHYVSGEDCLSRYVNNVKIEEWHHARLEYEINWMGLEFVSAIVNHDNLEEMSSDDPIELCLTLKRNKSTIDECQIAIVFKDLSDVRFATVETPILKIPHGKTFFDVKIRLPYSNLAAGAYKMQFEVGMHDFARHTMNYDIVSNVVFFKITKVNQDDNYVCWKDSYGHILVNPRLVESSIG